LRLFPKLFLAIATFILCSSNVFAQLSKPIPPKSTTISLPGAATVEMPQIDRIAIDREDADEDLFNQPRRVAYPFPTNYTMKDGTWTELPNGDRIWQFRIVASGAQAISLLYKDFYIPAGATMHVYNPKSGETIGAFTSANNKVTRKFATALTYGDQAIIEVFEPAAQRGQTSMTISQIGHAYRLVEVLNAAELAQRPSGSCQVNINCTEGNNWQNQKRGVARILMNGSGLCTGSLLNNTAQDGKPYFLTADHCIGTLDALGNTDASGYVFYWNYERATCDNTSATNSSETTSGATLKANDSDSDFALFELTEDPNTLYTVFFNGFSANAVPASNGVGIHHPAGDYKKIATHSIAPVSFTFGGRPSDSYWNISWDATTNGHSVTEGGSSGSPLFESTGVVIGQLYGGSSVNCSNPANDPGYYGKIAYSWNNGGATQAERRLRDWLDPVGNGSTLYQAGGTPPPPAPSIEFANVVGSIDVFEASATTPLDCREYTDVTFTVEASGVLSSPVTVSTSTFGTTDNADYILSPGSVILNSTTSSADFTLRVFNDDAVEAPEDLIIDLVTSSATIQPGTNSSITVNFIDDDLNVGSTTPITFMYETFDAGLPTSWQVIDGGSNTDTWEGVSQRSGSSLNGTSFAIADADAAGSGSTMNEMLVSPVIDVSAATTLELDFEQYFRVYNAGGAEVGKVDVFLNGTWFTIITQNQAGGSIGSFTNPANTVFNLTNFISSTFQIRFHYTAAYDWYWAIDNVEIRGTVPEVASTGIVAPSQVYFGPNQKVPVRDPSNFNVIAELTNTSSNDYGCVLIDVDRDASTQSTYPFFSNDPAAFAYAKTMNISPLSGGGSGSYKLRWFFGNAELGDWTTTTGAALTDAGFSKVSGATSFGQVTPANFASYVVDWQPATFGTVGAVEYLESTFASGFSSFGLSLNPLAPLPVELVSFTGNHLPGRGNLIEWKTASEWENAYFELQHSTDGISFQRNTTVNAGEAPLEIQHYSHLDAKPVSTTTYYRLRQVDVDGTEDYSNIIAISSYKSTFEEFSARSLSAFDLEINLPAAVSELRLFSSTGQLVQEWNQPQEGRSVAHVHQGLTTGLYVLEATNLSGETYQVKLLVP